MSTTAPMTDTDVHNRVADDGSASTPPLSTVVISSTALVGTLRMPGRGVWDGPEDLNALASICDLIAKATNTPIEYRGKPANVFTVAMRAHAFNIPIMTALDNIYVDHEGKIGLSARLMNFLMTRGGCDITVHTFTDQKCILTMTRADRPGKVMRAEYSVLEAAVAGLVKHDLWIKYTKDSLFARAISRLGRQSAADLTLGCYGIDEVKEMNEHPASAVDIVDGEIVLPDDITEFLGKIADAPDQKACGKLWAEAAQHEWLDVVIDSDGATIRTKINDRSDELVQKDADSDDDTTDHVDGGWRPHSTVVEEYLRTLPCGCEVDDVWRRGAHNDDCPNRKPRDTSRPEVVRNVIEAEFSDAWTAPGDTAKGDDPWA